MHMRVICHAHVTHTYTNTYTHMISRQNSLLPFALSLYQPLSLSHFLTPSLPSLYPLFLFVPLSISPSSSLSFPLFLPPSPLFLCLSPTEILAVDTSDNQVCLCLCVHVSMCLCVCISVSLCVCVGL